MTNIKRYIPNTPIESCFRRTEIPGWVMEVCRPSAEYRVFALPSPLGLNSDDCPKDRLPDIGNKTPKEMALTVKACIRWIKAIIKKIERQLPKGKNYMDMTTPRVRRSRACLQRQIRELENWRESLENGCYDVIKQEEIKQEVMNVPHDEANPEAHIKIEEAQATEAWAKKEEEKEGRIKIGECDWATNF